MRDDIQAIYDRIPEIPCKGLCQRSCMGPIPATRAERKQLRGLPLMETGCSHLTENGRCDAHERRPLICRLWGVAENMACPWGCVPDGGHLTRQQAGELVGEMVAVAGEVVT